MRFGLKELLCGITLLCAGLGIAVASSYFYAVCFFAFSLMMIDVIFDVINRKGALGLFGIAIIYAVIDLSLVGLHPRAFAESIPFWSAVLLCPGLMMLALVVYASRAKIRYYWLSLVGFVVWMLCVAFANLYIVAHATSVA